MLSALATSDHLATPYYLTMYSTTLLSNGLATGYGRAHSAGGGFSTSLLGVQFPCRPHLIYQNTSNPEIIRHLTMSIINSDLKTSQYSGSSALNQQVDLYSMYPLALSILRFIANNDRVTTRQIAEAVHASSSSANKNTNKLVDLGLVEKGVKYGTEHRSKPTQEFSLSAKANKQEIEIAYKQRIEMQQTKKQAEIGINLANSTQLDIEPSETKDDDVETKGKELPDPQSINLHKRVKNLRKK
jgi:predicted transcriptional regulator